MYLVVAGSSAQGLPLVGTKISHADQREGHPKGYTNHEVIACRAGSPSGRTRL
jgi:hypothetical protein